MKYPKSTFSKLYLIEKEMYDRVLTQLNAVDKEELADLNAEHAPEYTALEEPALNEDGDAIENNGTDYQIESPIKADPVENNLIPDQVVSKPPKKIRIKKFACDICVDKKFTTRYSLNRHKKSFHSPEQTVSKPEVQEKPVAPVKNFKRKRVEEEEEEENDNFDTNYPMKKPRIMKRPENRLLTTATKRKAVGKDLRPSKKFRWENY